MLCSFKMAEGSTLAALLDALGRSQVAVHEIREVWEGETDGKLEALSWGRRPDGNRASYGGCHELTPDHLSSPHQNWTDRTC